MSEAGWKADPSKQHEWRYWDGVGWTDQVSDAGEVSTSPYDPSIVPPPPTAPPSAPTAEPAATRPRSVSYELMLLDRKGREILTTPFQSPDLAMQFAQQNPSVRMKHTLGSAFMKGAIRPNDVSWRTAVILETDDGTGECTEYHRIHK